MIADTAASSYFNLVVIQHVLRSCGLDADEIIREAGIVVDDYKRGFQRIPVEKVDRLYELSVEATGNPAFGLELARQFNPTVYSALGVAMMCSRSIRDLLCRFERFFGIITTLDRVEFAETDTGASLATYPLTDYGQALSHCHSDSFLAVVVKFIRLVHGQDYNPDKIELNWTPPESHIQEYHDMFACEIVFDAPTTVIHIHKDDLDVELTGTNDELARQHDKLAVETLAKTAKVDLPSQVYARLLEYLPTGDCSRERVASSFNMSASAFQKKLHNAGTSFQELLDHTREELAKQYIGKDDLSIGEAAYLLGFTDCSNFSRAFKRWVGLSPRDYRNQYMAGTDDPGPR